ncbi:hypothetical protein IHV09_14165 [Fictibacillus sp. 23RED33]|uniref:hypothetical protein n=1 Tax=Fictibacillus sp. 23RED33 TaxID=2745879 RepID=UPI0018CDF31C|nr:hypothetical protein [Fictibacillus sp. 23RED33]MBH0174709.1 hypothetical protein [Fictibacillus sp. 23RED33]
MTKAVEEKNSIDKYSLKAITIQQLGFLTQKFNKMNINNDFQLLLMTQFGFIKCDLELEIPEDDDFFTPIPNQEDRYQLNLSYLLKQRKEVVKMFEEKGPIEFVDNGTTLSLKNVSIFKDDMLNPIARLEQMLVFADQISGLTIVPRNN